MFCSVQHLKISPWFFCFLFEDYTIAQGVMKIVLLFGVVIILGNIVEFQKDAYYLLSRIGRVCFFTGDILYIALVSICYPFILLLCSWLFFIPHIAYDPKWGKIIGTLVLTDAKTQYAPTFVMNAPIVQNYNPIQATLYTFLLAALGTAFLGYLIYIVTLLTKHKVIGILAALLGILLCPVVSYLRIPSLYWLSPMSWISIANLNIAKGQEYPTLGYSICGLFLLNLSLAIASIQLGKRMEIQ